jgi:ABC-type antimicrobial peptide transport system permease subunit
MAERYWPGQDPIGKRLRRGLPETSTPWMTVVGEVDDVKLGPADAETMPQVYQPATQTVASEGPLASAEELSATDGWIVLHSRMDPDQIEDTLRATLRKIDPQLPLYQMQTMEHAISKSEAPRRFNTVLISSFATAAVLLSVLGIYGVIAFSVALREQEMSVRIALGCQRSAVILLILSSGARLAAVGCGLGLLGAVAASRLLRSFLFEVSPFDPGGACTFCHRNVVTGAGSFCTTGQTGIEYGSYAGLARRIGSCREDIRRTSRVCSLAE